MSRRAYRDHQIKVGLTVSIVTLALITGVIHYTIGGFGSVTGLMFYGNAAAYAFLAAALVAPIALAQRYAFLTRLALAGVAAATIVGWVLFGARYDVAYLSKAVEVALIAVAFAATYRDRQAVVALVQSARRRLPFGRVAA